MIFNKVQVNSPLASQGDCYHGQDIEKAKKIFRESLPDGLHTHYTDNQKII
jgi:hypothetical protein